MTDETKVNGEEIKNEAVNEEKVDAPEADAKEVSEDAKEDKTKKKKNKKQDAEIAALEEKLRESEDRYLRILAEYDNFRKRSAKEKESLYADSVADSLKELLPVLDTLERAAMAEGDAETLHKGIEMTLKSFKDALTKLKVTEMDCVGKEFDPNVQNAVMHVEDETLGENVVAEVLMKGYEREGRVIRFAMVKVAN